MTTNFTITEKSVFIELAELRGSCFQLITSTDGTESTFVKVEIPMKEWKAILKKWKKQKKKPKSDCESIYSVDI